MGGRRLVWQILWACAGVAGLAVALVLAWLRPWVEKTSPETADLSPPPWSTSRFLNAGPDEEFIGSMSCAKCHGRHFQSYLHTKHSRALADIDVDAEPPDGRFRHAASGRYYRIYRRDQKLWHEEVVRTDDGKEIARVEAPIRYRIGSGSFGRGYLFEVDGFLHQSPLTWYPSKEAWGMAPGYDQPNNYSFERPVMLGCMVCHSGQVEAIGESVHRLTVHERAIGCENCHGPGSRHQAFHQSGKELSGEVDWTIVNPGKLSRPLLESVCSACHQGGAASVLLRGRKLTGSRPGRPSTDQRIDYQLDVDDERMTVVGHMEQMRRSVCYQKSPDLTCVSCHDLHTRENPKNLIAHYRQKCLDCHATKGCGLPPAQRFARNKADDCVACHMPRGDTEVPHVAFTHHRIGLHPQPRKAEAQRIPDLAPAVDFGPMSELDRKRNLGLAYVLAGQNPRHQHLAKVFRQRAVGLLLSVNDAGLRHDDTTAALAELLWNEDRDRAKQFGQRMLEEHGITADLRAQVQLFMAADELQDNNYDFAIDLLEDLTKRRRFAEDWRLLGGARLKQNQLQDALAAFQQALRIRPSRPTTHLGLAEVYRRLNQMHLAQEHLEKAEWLLHRQQD